MISMERKKVCWKELVAVSALDLDVVIIVIVVPIVIAAIVIIILRFILDAIVIDGNVVIFVVIFIVAVFAINLICIITCGFPFRFLLFRKSCRCFEHVINPLLSLWILMPLQLKHRSLLLPNTPTIGKAASETIPFIVDGLAALFRYDTNGVVLLSEVVEMTGLQTMELHLLGVGEFDIDWRVVDEVFDELGDLDR